MDSKNRLITIAISYENYLILKELGGMGDSFNDVITRILEVNRLMKTKEK
jgi:hypothetical protein